MQISLVNSILRIVFLSIGLTSLLILVTIWNLSSKQVNKQLNKELSIAQGVFSKVSEDRRTQLVNNASILTSDFGFKRAVATGDKATINSVLLNHGQRINADLVLLLDLESKVTGSYPENFNLFELYPNKNLLDFLLAHSQFDEFRLINNQLYQVIILPVKAPNFIAITALAFRYDEGALNELKSIIQGDILIRDKKENETDAVLVSTIESTEQNPVFLFDSENQWWLNIINNQPVYLTSDIELTGNANSNIRVSLAQDVTPIYREMLSTQLSVVAISAIVMLITFSMSFIFSKRVSRPVSLLVALSDRIADGDYTSQTHFQTRLTELSKLAKSLLKMRDNIRQREQEIQFRAEHDMLTKLKNRDFFEKALDQQLSIGKPLQTIAVSVAGFQEINDLYGFTNADRCLQVIAQRLEKVNGIKARLNSSDMILLPVTELSMTELRKIHASLEHPIVIDGLTISVRIVMSVIETDVQQDNAEDILRKLNIILDQAKNCADSILHYEAGREQQYLRRLAILTELKRTLTSKNEELFLVYQPKINLVTGKVQGAEALIRWVNDNLGFVPPDEFIGLAEQAGLIDQVTQWVMTRSVRDLLHFKSKNLEISVAINLSTQDVENKELLEYFKTLLKANNIKSSEIDLEVTESNIVADAATATTHLQNLREEGFEIAIDDFGTGYSSLAYLKNLPVTLIKIDRSFVMELSDNKDDQTLVKTTLQLARSFNLKVVAEGVENKASLQLLTDWGCDYAQGYYIAKPLPVDDLVNFVTDYNKAVIDCQQKEIQ